MCRKGKSEAVSKFIPLRNAYYLRTKQTIACNRRLFLVPFGKFLTDPIKYDSVYSIQHLAP